MHSTHEKIVLTSRWWPGLLVFIGAASGLWAICAVPLVSFAVVSGLTLKQRQASLALGTVWLIHQIMGFTLHHYPRTPDAFAWGLMLGLASWAALLVCQKIAGSLQPATAAIGSLLSGFVVYELLLWCASFVLGGGETFSNSIVAALLLVNAAWTAGLMALHRLVKG
ncbi:hypothetical protein [Gloeobacter kilaueensis]|uniref:Uncharacterized protein n=1 Tax=Gloeobacter kilaueensis (strain ATCC BAA-2537 / CCAP 1431/1 / ULC 316 / JS1) TaxID=1183438 RepID=U5QJA5_GLOK1|nr:hypothetical protein [Gloeobacter kilaueensis]AGY57704.1 hypothetical protein GKIL_1458 [Gloeobacter kilaueensis JS1]